MTNATVSPTQGESAMANMVAVSLELTIDIEAPAATVWQTLLEDIAQWWPESHRMTGPTGRIEMDARAGGLIVEYGDDIEALWGRVLSVHKNHSLVFASDISDPHCGPGFSYVSIALKEENGQTLLRLRDSLFGVDKGESDDRSGTEEGWRAIMGGLKAMAEKK